MRQSTREGHGMGGNSPVRVPSWAWPVITLCALLLGVTAITRGTSAVIHATDSDLTTFFFPSAQYILHGEPFKIYAVNVGGYPDYNPPLSIFLMAPLLGLAQVLGFAANYGEQITFVALPFILLVPVLGYLVIRTLRRLYPAIPDTQALLAYVLIVLSPLTWQTYGTWYHVEQPLMLCFLIGAVLMLQRRRPEIAGVLAALAVLSRTTALMPLLALGVLLLVAREWRTLITFAGFGAGITLVALAPFFLFDFADTKYSLLTWRGGAPLGGNTLWAIFSYSSTPGSLLALVSSVAKRLDMYVVVLFIAVAAFLAAWLLRVSAFERDAWAVMAVASLAVPMLSKTSWPYYFLEPFVLLVIWEFASMHDRRAGVWRWPVLSLSFLAVAATLSQYIGLHSVGYGDRVAVGLLESGTLFAFAWAIWLRARARKEGVLAPVTAGGNTFFMPGDAAASRGAATPASPASPASPPLSTAGPAGTSQAGASPAARPAIERVPAPTYFRTSADAGEPSLGGGAEPHRERAPRAPLWPPAAGDSASPGSPASSVAPGSPLVPGTPPSAPASAPRAPHAPRQPLWPPEAEHSRVDGPRDDLRAFGGFGALDAGWAGQPPSRIDSRSETRDGTRDERNEKPYGPLD